MDVQTQQAIARAVREHEEKLHKKVEATPDFAEAWLRWPGRYNTETRRRKKVGKQDALEKWILLSPEIQQFILELLRRGKIDKYDNSLPDFHRWLRRQMWKDYEDTKPMPLNLPDELTPKMKTVPLESQGKKPNRYEVMEKLGIDKSKPVMPI